MTEQLIHLLLQNNLRLGSAGNKEFANPTISLPDKLLTFQKEKGCGENLSTSNEFFKNIQYTQPSFQLLPVLQDNILGKSKWDQSGLSQAPDLVFLEFFMAFSFSVPHFYPGKSHEVWLWQMLTPFLPESATYPHSQRKNLGLWVCQQSLGAAATLTFSSSS